MKIVHFVFLSRLNHSLQQTQFQHNNHGLSTENYRSPNALFVTGILNDINSECIVIRDLLSEPNKAANENEHPQTQEDVTNEDDILNTLRNELDITEDINNVPHGGDLYVLAKRIMQQVIQD